MAENLGYKAFVSGEALEPYRRVKVDASTGRVWYADAGEDYIGITQERVTAAVLQITVRLKNVAGTVKVEAAGSFALVASLYGADDGKVDDVVVGGGKQFMALEAADADGNIVEVLPSGGGENVAGYFDADAGAISGGEAHGVDVVFTGTLSTNDGIVGHNVVVTPEGTAGMWASAYYGKVVLTDANDPIPGTGYASGAEFEVTCGSGITPCDIGILTLNDSVSCAHYAGAAYLRLMKYGDTDPINLVNFYHESVSAAHDSGRIIRTSTTPKAATHVVKCVVGSGNTPLYLLATTTAPDD